MSRNARATGARRQQTRRQFLQVEQLEERSVLAGNVTAMGFGGHLTLIGDNLDNQLKVTRVGTSQVQISSLDGSTRINGSLNPVTLQATSGINALLLGGDDVLELSGSTTSNFRVSGVSTINTGEGDDTVRFVNFSSAAGLILLAGGGNDTVTASLDAAAPTITSGGLRVNGPVVMNLGAGNDNVSLRDSAFNKTFVLDASIGNDTVDIRNTEFRSVTSLFGNIGTDTLNNAGNTFRIAPFVSSFENRTSINGPTANNDTATVAEGGSVTISVLGNDTAAGTLNSSTVAIVTNPTRGSAVVNSNGTITYTNAGGEFTSDTLTYTVRDSQGNISNTATVNVTVTPVNDLPVAVADNFTVNEGSTTTLNLGQNDTDAENRLNLGSIIITQQPTNGTVTVGTNGNVTYVASTGTATSDSFQYTIADQDGGVSLAGTVTIALTQVNSAPTIVPIADLSTNEDTATGSIAVTVGDDATPAANLTVTASSSDTTLVPNANIVVGGSGSARTLVITPAANLSGQTTITVTVTDAENQSTTETFVLTVDAQNDPPTISGATNVTTNEDTASAAMTINVGDAETPNGLTVTATSSNTNVVANNGIAITGSGATRSLFVTPVADAFGSSTITLTVSDGSATATQTFVVTVNSQNDLPTLTALDDVTAGVGTSLAPITAVGADLETAAGSLTYTATSDNQALIADSGLVFTGNSLQVTPVSGATGTANITVRVTDADNGFAEQTFTVNIDSQPTISAIADQTISSGTSTGALTFTVSDTETAAVDLTLSATSSNTTLVPLANISFGGTGANRAVTVSPAAGLTGSSTIVVTVTDASGLTATESFVVTVETPNTLPTISAIADVSVDEDATIAPIAITVGDAETQLDALTFSVTSDNTALVPITNVAINGSGAARTVVVTPVANANGTAEITITVNDGDGGTAQSAFTVNVASVNDAPVAGTASATVAEGGNVIIDLGAVSTDVDSALNLAAGIEITQQGANGNVTLNGDGTVTYTHNGTETTTDSFSYTIADNQGNVSAPATVNVTVTPVNDAPAATDDQADGNFTAGSATPVTITGNLLTNDTDPDTAALNLFISALGSGQVGGPIQLTYGELTINADGSYSYTIDPTLVDEFVAGTNLDEELVTYTLSDGALTDLATLAIDLHILAGGN